MLSKSEFGNCVYFLSECLPRLVVYPEIESTDASKNLTFYIRICDVSEFSTTEKYSKFIFLIFGDI